MGIIPGKRETMKDRFIKVLRRECNESEGFIVLSINTAKPGHNPYYIYKILNVQQVKKIEKTVMRKYNDDLYHYNKKNNRLDSLLYVNGKHDIDEILYGLELNRDYIFTG